MCAANHVLEPTRLSWLESEGSFGLVSNLAAWLFLYSHLVAEHWPLDNFPLSVYQKHVANDSARVLGDEGLGQ